MKKFSFKKIVTIFLLFGFTVFLNNYLLSNDVNASTQGGMMMCKVVGGGMGSNCHIFEWMSDYTWKICDEDWSNCRIETLTPREWTVRGADGNSYILKNSIDSTCVLNFPEFNSNPNYCWEMEGYANLFCDWENNMASCHVESDVKKELNWNVNGGSATEYLWIKPLSDLVWNKIGLQSFFVGRVRNNDLKFYDATDYNNIYEFSFTKDEIKQYGSPSHYRSERNGKVTEYTNYSLNACVQYNWGGQSSGGWSAFWNDMCSGVYVKETDNGYLNFSATSNATTVNGKDVSEKQWRYKNASSKAEFVEGVDEGTVVVGFSHQIKPSSNDMRNVPIRTEIGTQVRINRFVNGSTTTTEWTNYYGPGGNRVGEAWQRINTYNSSNLSAIGDNVSVNIQLGEEVEVCQRIAYDNVIRVTTVTNEDGSRTTTTHPMATSNNSYTILKDENGNEIVAALPSAYSDWACVTLRGIRNMSEFEGISTVTHGSDQATTDWTRTSKTAYLKLSPENCGSECRISFTHGLRRLNGNGSSYYTLTRVSKNGYTITDRIETGWVGDTQKNFPSNEVTIYPGEMVCESLQFNNMIGSTTPNSDEIDFRSNATTRACAIFPADFTSSIDVKIRNKDVTAWSDWRDDMIVARPGNHLELIGTYTPLYQHTIKFRPGYTRVGSYGTDYENNKKTVQQVFNEHSSYAWQNAFSLTSYELSGCTSNTSLFNGVLGSDDPYAKTTSFVVGGGSVGYVRTGSATTNNCSSSSSRTTPKGVTFKKSGDDKYVAVVNTESINDRVSYKVPYNFNTSISTTNPTDDKIFAGEEKSVDGFKVNVLPRENSLLNDTYATVMKSAKLRLISYTLDSGNPKSGTDEYASGQNGNDNSLCSYFNSPVTVSCGIASSKNSQTFNSSGNLNGSSSNVLSMRVKASDEKAGTKICVALALYPSNSGAPDSIDVKGSDSWRISNSICYTVAKKPSIQVWGGNFYSSGKVSTFVSTKYNLKGQTVNWSENNSSAYVFGSWVEGAVVSNGEVKGLASGAGTGYKKSGTSMTVGGAYGSGSNIYFCARSPLSFATVYNNCNNLAGSVGKIGKSTEPGDKAELYERFAKYTNADEAQSVGLGDYTVLGNDSIPGMSIPKGTTKIFRSNGTLTITGDIVYADSYTSLAEVPKVIIYAKNGINIQCNVQRIDALIMTDGTVDTCIDVQAKRPEDAPNKNPNDYQELSNQLKVNGAIIANELKARRTYGASTGINTIIPSEIVDYDSTFYLWGAANAEAAKSGTLSNVYLRELSPRY